MAVACPSVFVRSTQRHRVVLKNLPHSFTWRELKDEMRRIGDVIYADVDTNGDGCAGQPARESASMRTPQYEYL